MAPAPTLSPGFFLTLIATLACFAATLAPPLDEACGAGAGGCQADEETELLKSSLLQHQLRAPKRAQEDTEDNVPSGPASLAGQQNHGCIDTPGWTNGPSGYSCSGHKSYNHEGWCAGGQVKHQWAVGPGYNYPERNCCVCGKQATNINEAADTCAAAGSCTVFRHNAPCQCNAKCAEFNNCCKDYISQCGGYRLGEKVWDKRLLSPSSAPLLTFYAYRAQKDVSYPPENTNLASLGGVLWYIHNELINHCATDRGKGELGFRRFKVTRILRYKIQMKATEPLYRDLHMNFGSRVAFDFGKNTGAWEHDKDEKQYYKYGYNVGCNRLGDGPYPLCPSGAGDWEHFCPITYTDPYWYSMPGECPTMDINSKTAVCKSELPGGACKGTPTGQGNCTFSWEEAGEVNIDDMVGITEKYGSHLAFCKAGCVEYNKFGSHRDEGKCVTWWNHRDSGAANRQRMQQVDDFFQKHYPNMPRESTMKPPRCDFNRQRFYGSF